jgi:hypothetical protein
MRVKIGEIWYDGNDQPLMVELTEDDKKNIADANKLKKFCQFPDTGYSKEDIIKWMEIDNMEEDISVIVHNMEKPDDVVKVHKTLENIFG